MKFITLPKTKIKSLIFFLACFTISISIFAGCTSVPPGNPGDFYNQGNVDNFSPDNGNNSTSDVNDQIIASDAGSTKAEITDEFSLSSDIQDGYKIDGGICEISVGGEYTLSGLISDGQIVITAPKSEKVTLMLNGLSLSCSSSAPLVIKSADSVTIKTAEGSYNEIIDNRALVVSSDSETDSLTENAAITSSCDLTLSGSGNLVVTSQNNSGIHTKDDLTIKKLTLKVTSLGYSAKGNDSVSIESGNIILISASGDGLKTSNAEISTSGKQRGNITISGGKLNIFAAKDGISAAYNAEILAGASIAIYTDSYSSYSGGSVSSSLETSAEAAPMSLYAGGRPGGFGGFGGPGGFGGFGGNNNPSLQAYSTKGIKAVNELIISGGILEISSSDDSLHSDKMLTISGGTITVNTKDDGLHADNTVEISGGKINVVTSYEGIEGSIINIKGGEIDVYATDDGINASAKTASPSINISGGMTTVRTPSGDTDAIDSNGNYIQTGGFVLVKGGNSQGRNAGSVDTDGSIKITGGLIMAFGGICEIPSSGSNNTAIWNGTSFASGTYTLSAGGTKLAEFNLAENYSSLWICGEALSNGTSLILEKNGSQIAKWTQSSTTQYIQGSSVNGGGFGGGFGGRW